AAPLRWAGLTVEAPPKAPGKDSPSAPLPSAPPEAWTAVLENIRDHGKYEPGDFFFPPRFDFEDVKGATDAAHTADYVTVYGEIGEDDGLFHPDWVDV